MDHWQLQSGSELSTLTEAELHALAATGALQPTDLVRPPGATGFVPLQHLRLPGPSAETPSLRALVVHGVIFLGAVGFLMRGPLLALATLWTVALLAHGVWVVMGRRAAVAPALPAPAPARSPFLEEVEQAAAAVARAWEEAPQALGRPPDLAGLRAAAARLDSAHTALSRLDGTGSPEALRAERLAAEQRAASAQDAASAEIFAAELGAIDDRLAAWEASRVVAEQLAARKRTLLHQLAGLRLAAVQTAVSHEGPDPAAAADQLVGRTAELRDALQASAEVEDALAQARAAARQRQS